MNRLAASCRNVRPILLGLTAAVLLMILAFPAGFVAQQASSAKPAVRSTAKAPSPFADAEVLLQQGKLEEAKSRLQEEIQQHPAKAEGYGLLGLVYTAEKNYADALSSFQQGLKINPNSTGIRNDLGNLYVLEGDWDRAEKEFREVLRLSPTNSDGNYNLGLVLLTKKRPGEAIACFERVHPPKIDEARKAVAQMDQLSGGDFRTSTGVGVLLARYRLYDDAIQHFQTALKANPDSDVVE